LSLLPQVARAILENPNDNTKVHLIYANVTYEDILLKVEFSIVMVVIVNLHNMIYGIFLVDVVVSVSSTVPSVVYMI
jgi:NAD(P)H-flavin reductase